jgi:hypothetical protein
MLEAAAAALGSVIVFTLAWTTAFESSVIVLSSVIIKCVFAIFIQKRPQE